MTSAASAPDRASDRAADLERLERLLARGVEVVRVIHPDLFGRQRGKQYPVSELDSILGGVAYSKMSVAEDLFGVPVDETEFPQLAGHPDLHAQVDPGSAFVPPWEPDSVWLMSTLWEHGAPSPLCARNQLERSIQQLQQEHGLSCVAAGEPEFYLFERDAAGRATHTPYSLDGVSYTIDRITDPKGVLGRIHRQLIDFGINVTVLNREFSPGQFEINLRHAPALEAADDVFLLKTALKELATIEGYAANFMAKPIQGEEGSSLHVHISLWDGDRNVFDSGGDDLNDAVRHVLGGLQAHAAALTAFTSPTINSYKRLHGEGLSPDSATWGEDNRYTYLRIPAERGKASRIELRAGDASANPYLLIAAMMHAARDGLTRKLEPSGHGEALPRTLDEAIAALRADEVFTSGFGAEFVDVYAALKTRETSNFARSVTDWEWNTYQSHV